MIAVQAIELAAMASEKRDTVTEKEKDVSLIDHDCSEFEVRWVDPNEITESRLYKNNTGRGSKHLRQSIESIGIQKPLRGRVENEEIVYFEGGRRVDEAQDAGKEVPVLLPTDGELSDEKILLGQLLANTTALSEEADWLRRAWLLEDWWEEAGETQNPATTVVSDKLGISNSDASRWVEPLRSRWEKTIIDRNMFDGEQIFQSENNDNYLIGGLHINDIVVGVNPLRLQDINAIVKESTHLGSDLELRAKLLNAYVQDDISYDELKQLKQRIKDEQISAEDALQNIRHEAPRSIETSLGGEIARKVTALADETGKDETEIIEDSVQQQLSNENMEFPGSEEQTEEYLGQFEYLQQHVNGPLPEPDLWMVSNEQMTDLSADSIGLTVTSPPYNVDWEYSEATTDNQPYAEYLENLIQEPFAEVYRLTVLGGYCCIVVPLIIDVDSEEMQTPVGTSIAADIIDILTSEGWELFDQIIWDKRFNEAGLREQQFPFPESRLNNFAETVLVFKKPGTRDVDHDQKHQSKIIKQDTVEDRDIRDNIWHISPAQWEPRYTEENNTAQFPEELAKRCILHWSYVGDTVLDPFCGRGTTLKMAKQLHRESIGYEIQEGLERDIREYVGMG